MSVARTPDAQVLDAESCGALLAAWVIGLHRSGHGRVVVGDRRPGPESSGADPVV